MTLVPKPACMVNTETVTGGVRMIIEKAERRYRDKRYIQKGYPVNIAAPSLFLIAFLYYSTMGSKATS